MYEIDVTTCVLELTAQQNLRFFFLTNIDELNYCLQSFA